MSKYVEDIARKFNEEYLDATITGLKNGSIRLYNNDEITNLRNTINVIPASITLLCFELCKGKCNEMAFLLSRSFLDSDDDIRLCNADINALRFNPQYIKDHDKDSLAYDHCFVIRTTKDGKKYVYDTSVGFVYDYDLYMKIEEPTYRKIVGKGYIRDRLEYLKRTNPERFEINDVFGVIVVNKLKEQYKKPHEFYSKKNNNGKLEREIDLFKEQIDYDRIIVEKAEEIKSLSLKLGQKKED